MIRPRFLMISAIILTTACLAGCAGDAAIRAPLSRDPGPAPAYLHPVKVAQPRAGTSPVVDADRNAGGVSQANTIIACAREDWDKMRARMISPEPVADTAAQADCVADAKAKAPKKKKRRVRLGG